ncbi:ArsR family transcriptional regulator [Clostridia bacterium]|nr:ArsR family transcriptional regulator [Clostridia bacterium]
MKEMDLAGIRRRNMERVWSALLRGPMSRQALAESTGLSLMTVSNLIELFGVREAVRFEPLPREPGQPSSGRRAESISIRTDKHLLFALDLTGRQFRLHTLALDASPLLPEFVSQEQTDQARYEQDLRAFLMEHAELISLALPGRSAVGLCVVTPGSYDADSDTIRNKRIPGLNGLPLKPLVLDALAPLGSVMDCFVEEDVKLSIRAHLGRGLPDPFYYLYIGEGVGGAYSSRGEILRGLNAVAGDAGQMRYDAGRTFEQRLSLRAYRTLRQTLPVRDALSHAAKDCGALFQNIVWLLDPALILVDCAYAMDDADWFQRCLNRELTRALSGHVARIPQIQLTGESARALLRGAAYALTQRWFERVIKD